MKKITLAAAAAMACAATATAITNATAADVIRKARPPVTEAVPPYSWTGFYAGANFGGGWTNGTFANLNNGISHRVGGSEFIGGLQAGYNYQFGNLVLGVEGELDWTSYHHSLDIPLPLAGVAGFSHDVNRISTVAGRVGLGWDRWLVYGKVGAGWLSTTSSVIVPNRTNWQSTETHSGWLLGGGIEYAFAASWTAKLEYSYFDLPDWTAAPLPPLVSRDVQLIKAGLNYRFGYAAPASHAAVKAGAGPSTEDLAKASQNPVADMISLPFQNNTNFNTGPHNRAQNVLNIQPVIPMTLNADWNVISRTIVPVMSQPRLFSDSNTNGIGDITQSLFLSPSKPTNGLVWGVGPVFTAPSASETILGTGKTLFGATAVALVMPGHWVIGVLANNQWSVAGDPLRKQVNTFLAQPFVNYNMDHGWFVSYSPIITADWLASADQRWTVPIGGGVGRVFKIGEQPVSASVSAYYNVVRPDSAGDWQLRAQFAFLFPR